MIACMTDSLDDEGTPWQTYAEMLDEGAVIGMAFADEPDLIREGSSFHLLRQLAESGSPVGWGASDVVFANDCVRGLVGIVAYQLRGLGQMLRASRSVPLHPLVTLVRGVAEAAGALWWHVEPWIDRRPAQAPVGEATEWERRADMVIARSQLRHVTELANRRRRTIASYGEDSAEARSAVRALEHSKADLAARYGDSALLQGHSRRWRLKEESIPEWGDLVHHALEFGHGQVLDGRIVQRIYPLLSGFAHPSLEMLYAHTTKRGPLTPQLLCSSAEARQLISTAGRIAAGAYDLAFEICGINDAARLEWEEAFDRQVVFVDD